MMDTKPKSLSQLEQFTQAHCLDEEERKTLKAYFEYCPELGEIIIKWYCFHNKKDREVSAAGLAIGNDEDSYWVSTFPVKTILPSLAKNYEKVASYPPEVGRGIVLPAIIVLAPSEERGAQVALLEDILAFLDKEEEKSNRLPSSSRQSLVEFIGDISKRKMTAALRKHTSLYGFKRNDIRALAEAYQGWYELGLADETGIGPQLLREIASQNRLPQLHEDGHITHNAGRRYDFKPLSDAVKEYKQYFNLHSRIKFPSGMVVRHLRQVMARFSPLLEVYEDANGRMHSRERTGRTPTFFYVDNENVQRAFARLGELQKCLDAMHQNLQQLEDDAGLAQKILLKLSDEGKVPVPDREGNIYFPAGQKNKNLDDYVSTLLSNSAGLYSERYSHLKNIGLLLAKCKEYDMGSWQQHYPREELIGGISSFFQQHGLSRVPALFSILKRQEVRSVEEAVECALLDIPSYQILRKLGEGVYKKVFLGINTLSDGKKALKVVDISERGKVLLQQRNLEVDRFVREEAIKSVKVGEIGNPHLNRVEDIRRQPNTGRYVIYEELFDHTLEKVVEEREPTGWKDKQKGLLLSYATQIASGLAALHQQGMVHGDLTLSNIGVKDGIIKITDFGLASSLGSLALETRERDAGCLLVRAPELFDEKNSPSKKSDVWSLGVIVYKLWTGAYPPFIPAGERPLFPGPERSAYETEVRRRIKETKLESLYESFPGRVKHLLKSCLQKEPEKRKTMKEIYDSLRRWYFHFEAIYSEQCDEVVEGWREKHEHTRLGDKYYLENEYLPFIRELLFIYDYTFLINQKKEVLVQKKVECSWDGKLCWESGMLSYKSEEPHYLLRNFESPSLGHALTCWIARSLKSKDLDPDLGLDLYNKSHGEMLPQRKSLIISHPSCREELEDYLVDVDELSDAEFRRLSYSPMLDNDNNGDEDHSIRDDGDYGYQE